jgi:hypothetical protein
MSNPEDNAAAFDKDGDISAKRPPAITNVRKDLPTGLVQKVSSIVNNKATNKLWKDKKDAS